jgi:hypothetical protein
LISEEDEDLGINWVLLRPLFFDLFSSLLAKVDGSIVALLVMVAPESGGVGLLGCVLDSLVDVMASSFKSVFSYGKLMKLLAITSTKESSTHPSKPTPPLSGATITNNATMLPSTLARRLLKRSKKSGLSNTQLIPRSSSSSEINMK